MVSFAMLSLDYSPTAVILMVREPQKTHRRFGDSPDPFQDRHFEETPQ